MGMTQDLNQCVFQILSIHDKNMVVGAGFVLTNRLAVTCAHVVHAAESDCGQFLSILFPHTMIQQTIQVLVEGWSPYDTDEDANDIAFLLLEYLPDGIFPVVLGTAKGRNRHPFTALGFPLLAGYENRFADGHLGGVVSVRGKHPTLQFEGGKIKEGMSGAPVLDLETNRVVGMVSEYKDDTVERFAWATTAETLVALQPVLQLWPDAYGPDDLSLYLDYLIDINGTLTLPNGRETFLEQVYVSLRTDEMNVKERKAEHALYLEDVAALRKVARARISDQYAEFAAMRKAIARHPTMFMLDARNWTRLFGERTQKLFNLAEVVQLHAHVVVLGDPGSGKTTLCKWLTLQFARALCQKEDHVLVRADMVYPGSAAETILDLGSTRLPVFLSIADYARARWPKGRKDSELTLEEFLGSTVYLNRLPPELTRESCRALIRDYLRQGKLLVILDGLDEVDNPSRRKKVLEAVRRFIQDLSSTSTTEDSSGSEERPASPEQWCNRVVLTSRIVGYQFDPLIELPHYTIEEMDDTAITAFCHAWMRYVATPVIPDTSEVARLAEQLKEAIFSYAHPGMRSMAGNPLLLTIITQVYWSNRSHDGSRALPTRRVALFEAALQAFYDQRETIWDQVNITSERLSQAFGVVAAAIHGKTAGFVTEGEVRRLLRTVLDKEQVEVVLSVARDVSGFLVARGEGIYGFLHRAVQEYFAAQHLVSQPEKIIENLVTRALNPIWREPVILALSIVSYPSHPENNRLSELFAALLDAPDPARDFLPQSELLAATICMECEYVPQGVVRHIATNLLSYYAQRNGRNRSEALSQRIQQVFVALRSSSAAVKREVEEVLCTEIQDAKFERRYYAINLVIAAQWDSSAIAKALVDAWRAYADPAGSLLVALEDLFKRQPNCFQEGFLPLRQIMKKHPQLWERARASQEWRNILRILYLPLNADFEPEQVNRDSPLTEQVVAALTQNASDQQRLAIFRRHLVSLIKQPVTAKVRDAVLLLSALGDASWIRVLLDLRGNQEYLVRSVLAPLSYFSILASIHTYSLAIGPADSLDRALANARTYAREYAHKLTHISNLASICTNARSSTRAISPARALADALISLKARTKSRIHTHTFDLSLARADVRTLSRNLDLFRTNDLIRTRSLAKDLALIDTSNRMYEIEQFILAACQRWAKDALLMRTLSAALTSLRELNQHESILLPSTSIWATFVDACVRWSAGSKRVVHEGKPRAAVMTLEELKMLIDDLSVPDDDRRDHARRELNTERNASFLGKPLIEHMATFVSNLVANGHEKHHVQVGTQLEWALHHIIHNRPDWIHSWVVEASKTEYGPDVTILSNIHRVTPEAFEALMQAIPANLPWVNKALLISLKWLVRLRQIPTGRSHRFVNHLLHWFSQEKDTSIRSTILEILGCWQEEETVYTVGTRLLKLLNEYNDIILYKVLLRLAPREPALLERVLPTMLSSISQLRDLTVAQVYQSRIEEQRTVEEQLPFVEDEERRRYQQAIGDWILETLMQIEAPVGDEEHRRYHPQAIAIAIRDQIRMMPRPIISQIDPIVWFTSMLEVGIDDDWWDEGYHNLIAIVAQRYLERSPDSLIPELLEVLLERLQESVEVSNWPTRRMALAIMVACAEVMPTVLQQIAQKKLETLLITCAADAESFSARRFALTTLSYLRTVTSNIAQVLLAACQDVEEVQQAAIVAAGRFQSIEGDPLTQLIPALTGESKSTAYAVAELLGALDASAAGEAANLYEQIIEALVNALKDPGCQQEVMISGQSKGKLEVKLYEILLRVQSGL